MTKLGYLAFGLVLLLGCWVGSYVFLGWLIDLVGLRQLVHVLGAFTLGAGAAAAVVRFIVAIDKASQS